METIKSSSAKRTAELGAEWAQIILKNAELPKENRGAIIIALQGDLGAGKTTFTQGFARGLGIKRRLISPTFVIMRRYAIPTTQKFKHLYHIDAYRLKNPDGLETLGLKAIFSDSMAIVLVEWPENIKKVIPGNAMQINFAHGKNEHERMIDRR